ncbi:hypothetical protein ALC62_03500 [Cyphomyrmex costatus]|uniref:Uncharacterized protein n=1 Tax=Cyphomyrmex costatus TaxID=456900 RepID=A0A151ILF0_9HYME|nr:hypothetical protein ALC62_03500 [Cyphomyrmex costatus]
MALSMRPSLLVGKRFLVDDPRVKRSIRHDGSPCHNWLCLGHPRDLPSAATLSDFRTGSARLVEGSESRRGSGRIVDITVESARYGTSKKEKQGKGIERQKYVRVKGRDRSDARGELQVGKQVREEDRWIPRCAHLAALHMRALVSDSPTEVPFLLNNADDLPGIMIVSQATDLYVQPSPIPRSRLTKYFTRSAFIKINISSMKNCGVHTRFLRMMKIVSI